MAGQFQHSTLRICPLTAPSPAQRLWAHVGAPTVPPPRPHAVTSPGNSGADIGAMGGAGGVIVFSTHRESAFARR